jgi:hypothetical protein
MDDKHVAQFRYFGMTVTNQNSIQEEIKRRLNSGNACYHSVQNLLSPCVLSRNTKIRIYKTIILPVYFKLGTLTVIYQSRFPSGDGQNRLKCVVELTVCME